MPKGVQDYLTEPEVMDLLRQPDRFSVLGKRDYAILRLMLKTGLRRSEVCKLDQGDLRPQGKIVYLYVWGKGEKERKIPIKDLKLIEAIHTYWKAAFIPHFPDQPIFTCVGFRGPRQFAPITPRIIYYIVKKYAHLAKIPKKIHPHTLRHTCFTLMLHKGVDIVTVQTIAGHSNINTTRQYLHTHDELMEKAVDLLKF